MEKIESNSIRSKEQRDKKAVVEKKKIEKVVKNKATVQKKTFWQKTADSLFSTSGESIGSYLLGDVLIPAIKDTVVDSVTSAINMAFYGDTRGPSNRSRSTRSSISRGEWRSYDSYYNNERVRTVRDSPRDRYDVGNIEFATRGDAEEVLDILVDAVEMYDMVTVGDLYDAAGLQTRSTDYNYGWFALGGARIHPTKTGYVLELPRPEPL